MFYLMYTNILIFIGEVAIRYYKRMARVKEKRGLWAV